MAGFIIPFPCLELDVSNTFHVNTTVATFGNVTINTTALSINAATLGTLFTQTGYLVGNSTSNTIINSTALTVSNGNFVASYGETLRLVDTGTAASNATANSTTFSVTNSSGAFFVANTLGIFLGSPGNLANLTTTKLSLGDGSTHFGPDGLSIGNSTVNSIMNLTHLTVTTISGGSLTANFTGNATKLDIFGVGKAGIVNASTDDANTILRSDGQWVKPGLFWYDADRGAINQANLDIFWNGQDYSMIEISGWLLPEDDDIGLEFLVSDDGSTFTGFGSTYHERKRSFFFPGHTTQTSSADNNFSATPASADPGGIRDGNNGIFFIITIHNHHNMFSTVQVKSGYDGSGDPSFAGDMDVLANRGWGILSDTSTVQGIRFRFTSGNIVNHSYAVKLYPN